LFAIATESPGTRLRKSFVRSLNLSREFGQAVAEKSSIAQHGLQLSKLLNPDACTPQKIQPGGGARQYPPLASRSPSTCQHRGRHMIPIH